MVGRGSEKEEGGFFIILVKKVEDEGFVVHPADDRRRMMESSFFRCRGTNHPSIFGENLSNLKPGHSTSGRTHRDTVVEPRRCRRCEASCGGAEYGVARRGGRVRTERGKSARRDSARRRLPFGLQRDETSRLARFGGSANKEKVV